MVDRSLALLVTTGEDQGNGIEALYGLASYVTMCHGISQTPIIEPNGAAGASGWRFRTARQA
jgi:hypothetical protein